MCYEQKGNPLINNTSYTVCPFFNRTCSKANSSKYFHWKLMIFGYVIFQSDNISNFKFLKPEIKTFCFMMDFRNLVIFQKRLKITELLYDFALWKPFYRGNACNSVNSQLLSMKLYTSIIYGILHMLWKFKGKYNNESWNNKRCINGGTLSNFVNFGSFSVHLQTGIFQCKMYVRVSFWCHRKAHGLVSYFLEY